MKYNIDFTSRFKKDLKNSKKQHKDVDLLIDIIYKLCNEEKLDSKYKDHSLTGDYVDCRECHINPDWLLIYQVNLSNMMIILIRLGSHSELF